MSVQTQIDRITGEVNSQATKLAELKTILEGKAAGGAGGTALETCTININALDGGYITGYACTTFENGEITTIATSFTSNEVVEVTSVVLSNVVCNSMVNVQFMGISFEGVTLTNIERIGYVFTLSNGYYKAPSSAGDVATIEYYDND